MWVTCTTYKAIGLGRSQVTQPNHHYLVFRSCFICHCMCKHSVSVCFRAEAKRKKKSLGDVSHCAPNPSGWWTQIFSFFCLRAEHAWSALEGADCPHCKRLTLARLPPHPPLELLDKPEMGTLCLHTHRPLFGFGSSLWIWTCHCWDHIWAVKWGLTMTVMIAKSICSNWTFPSSKLFLFFFCNFYSNIRSVLNYFGSLRSICVRYR